MLPAMAVSKSKHTSPYPDHRWSELIDKMAGGDQASLADLYDQSSRLVFGLVLRIVNDRSAAEEITLDTYHQVWRQAANFKPERGTPTSWILTIARNRAIDRLRSTARPRKEQTPLEDVAPFLAGNDSPEETALLSEQQRIVRAALAQLRAEQRVLIEVAFFGGLTHYEIAEQFNLPLGTVKTRIRAGMQRLREILPPL